MLQELLLSLPEVSLDMARLLYPSLNHLRRLRVDVDVVKCDGMYHLFKACSNVKKRGLHLQVTYR